LVKLTGLRYGELDSVVNLGSYSSLTRLVEKDPLLKDVQIREMVIMRNIIQMYSSYRFSKQALGDILSDIASKGVTVENRKAATNIRKKMMDYDKKKAPEFTLADFQGQEHSLSSFEGKYVYLNFWNEQCARCLAEMDLTRELVLDFDDIIQFVSIYVGPDTAAARQMAKEREYKWLMLDYNHDFELLKNYKLELFPYYILLDKQGKIEWYPAYSPSKGFNAYFIKMLNDKKGNLD
jgi:thiol-disulfide isomerase/thioredoxin